MLRLLCLDPTAATFALFSYTADGQADPRDHGNLDTRLEPCRRLLPDDARATRRGLDLLSLPGVEAVSKPGGASLRVHGLEFAEVSGRDLLSRHGPAGSGARTSSGRNPERGRAPGVSALAAKLPTGDILCTGAIPKPGSSRGCGSNTKSWTQRY